MISAPAAEILLGMTTGSRAEDEAPERLADTMRAMDEGRPVFGCGWRAKWRRSRFLRDLGRADYRRVLAAYYSGSSHPEATVARHDDRIVVS